MKKENKIGFYFFVLTGFLFMLFTSCSKDKEEKTSNINGDLPVVVISTEGKTIVDEPKITARMQIMNTSYEFDGYIGIEIRGTTSQHFPKKSFNVETRTNAGENLNVSLLELPAENDWVLYGPYTDKTLIRNVLAYHLGNLTGRWSPRTKFCELYINDDYRGVYVLVEKIKRDKNRVNIASLKPADISGDDLTGGYLLKIDRPDPGYWISPYKARGDKQDVPISYVDPKYEDLASEQRLYIKNYVTDFENALYGENFTDQEKGYRPYVDIASFIDYFLINELSRNLDAYRVSTYFYKDKDSKGGKLTMGPFWDYDLAFGNANFFNAGDPQGWVVDGLGYGDAYGIPFWWDRLREDPYFEAQLKIRWKELRNDKFSNKNLNEFIDNCASLLASAQERNFQKFQILDTYVWPNNYIGKTYANEVNYLKNWINSRLSWMDSQLNY
jgi:spore coat protein CotH